VEGVRIQAEFVTVGDDRVCPDCLDLASGGPYTLKEIEGMIPAHPMCRCIALPLRPGQQQSRVGPYKEAGNIEEAENWVINNGYANSADYKQLDLATANQLNQTLARIHKGTRLNEISANARYFKGKNSGVSGFYKPDKNSIFLNPRRSVTTRVPTAVRAKEIQATRSELAKMLKNQRYMEREFGERGYMQSSVDQLRRRLAEYKRNRYHVTNSIDDVFIHEYGHKIQHLQKGQTPFGEPIRYADRLGGKNIFDQAYYDNKLRYLKGEIGATDGSWAGVRQQVQLSNEIKKTEAIIRNRKFISNELTEDRKRWFMENVSEYAATDVREAFAESYTMMIKGETLPEWLLDILRKGVQNAK